MAQARDDAAAGQSVESIPDASAGKDAIVDAATKNVFAQMDSDRKTTALKSIQVCAATHWLRLHTLNWCFPEQSACW